jgi:hypothetical protein
MKWHQVPAGTQVSTPLRIRLQREPGDRFLANSCGTYAA